MRTKFTLFSLAVVLILGTALWGFVSPLEAQTSSKLLSRVTDATEDATGLGQNGRVYLEGSYTFAARTDTVDFVFQWKRPSNSADTLRSMVLYTYSTDSLNASWTYQWSDDGTYWSTAVAIATDSADNSAANVTQREITVTRVQYGGFHQFARVRNIGNTPTGGKANEVGNVVKLRVIEGG